MQQRGLLSQSFFINWAFISYRGKEPSGTRCTEALKLSLEFNRVSISFFSSSRLVAPLPCSTSILTGGSTPGPCPNRNKSRTDILYGIFHRKPPNEKSETDSMDDNVFRTNSPGINGSCCDLSPYLLIMPGNPNKARITHCPRGGMDPNNLFHIHSSIGSQGRVLFLAFPKFILSSQGDFPQILNRLDVVGNQSNLFELILIKF
jgi:hypothetical protein